MTCSIYIYKPCDEPLIAEEEELDVKFLLNDLYRKVGELKRRIEILEARQ
jgi:hypothetical protein